MQKFCLITFITLVSLFCTSAYSAPELGKPAPKLIVKQLNGQTFNLASQKGYVTIIDVWATWCKPCRKEMPILDAFYRQYHSKGVEVLGLSDDRSRDIDNVRKVMTQFSFPAAVLANAKESNFGRPRVVPMTYVFDRSGILRATLWPGGTRVTEEHLEKVVKPLL